MKSAALRSRVYTRGQMVASPTRSPTTLPGDSADRELTLDYTGVSASLSFRIFLL